jgi:hypothetical protein
MVAEAPVGAAHSALARALEGGGKRQGARVEHGSETISDVVSPLGVA